MLSTGGADCWGDDSLGQLGNETIDGPDGENGYDTPQAVSNCASSRVPPGRRPTPPSLSPKSMVGGSLRPSKPSWCSVAKRSASPSLKYGISIDAPGQIGDAVAQQASRGLRVLSQLNHVAVKVLIASATTPGLRTRFVKDGAPARTAAA